MSTTNIPITLDIEPVDPFSLPVRFTAASGSGIARNGASEGGAIGGWLKNANGAVFGFSNNHVIAALNSGEKGDTVWQAGRRVGVLTGWTRLQPPPSVNRMDFAIFQLAKGEPWHWRHPRPVAWQPPTVNQPVYRVDREGMRKKGIITHTGGTLTVPFGTRSFIFKDIVAIRSTTTGPFSAPGESGALVMSGVNFASCMLFACSDDSEHTHSFAFPWGCVGDIYPEFRWA